MKKAILTVAMSVVMLTAMAQGHGYDRANMDTSVKPGDDFREYATGNYIKTHPLRPDQMENGSFNDLFEKTQKQVNDLIKQYTSTPQQKGSIPQKIATIYNQMMDSVTRDRQGCEPIKANLEKVRAVKDIHDYQRVIGELYRTGSGASMFGIGVGADQRNADMNIVGISQGGLALGTRDYYIKTDSQTVAIRNAYMKYGKTLFQLVGYDEATAAKKMDAIYAIEKRIAEVSYDRLKLRDIDANYHPMPYQQLLTDFPGIDWTTIFWQSGFPAFDKVDVGQPEPIHEVEKIYAETPIEDLKSFAELRVIMGSTSYLNHEFHDAGLELSKVMYGLEADDPLWKRATDLVNGLLGWPIGKMYCEKYFPESSKQRVLELVHNLQKALSQRIDEATWMGAETKAQAKDKLTNFIIKIGYPDKWRDYSQMQVDDSLSLYQNVCNISAFLRQDVLQRKVGKPVDKMDWGDTPQTVNAYYSPHTNSILFPAAILQPPFFDPDADDALNYGAIGAVIGHEMSHGFDDQGCQFDKNGNQRNWWTAEDKKNFDKRAENLAKHFDAIEVVNGKNINGHQTLGENIGDNGGINISLRAMHNAGINSTIDGFTADQLFFLGYSFVWASNSRPQFLDMMITQDVHSPDFARVNGALPMIDEWYTAFNIKKGSKLFIPKNKRVHIW